MKEKITKEEMKQLWEEMCKNNKTQEEQNVFSKSIQDFIFNTIIDAPIMPDIKPINENDIIESLLDLNDDEIKQLYNSWDKGDCSLVGLTEIYLYQCIKKHKQENGDYYDIDYNNIHLRYGQH